MVYTDSPRDWLYFASNLRGNAKEDINVIYQLTPLDADTIKYEGIAKVQDGGRFTYWVSFCFVVVADQTFRILPTQETRGLL